MIRVSNLLDPDQDPRYQAIWAQYLWRYLADIPGNVLISNYGLEKAFLSKNTVPQLVFH